MEEINKGNLVPQDKSHMAARVLSIIGAVAGLVVIIGLIVGGALLASRKWDPVWNPFRPKINHESASIFSI